MPDREFISPEYFQCPLCMSIVPCNIKKGHLKITRFHCLNPFITSIIEAREPVENGEQTISEG